MWLGFGLVAAACATCAAAAGSKARFLSARAAASCVGSCRSGRSLTWFGLELGLGLGLGLGLAFGFGFGLGLGLGLGIGLAFGLAFGFGLAGA